MIFRQTWTRFSERWQSFGLTGLNSILLGLLTGAVLLVIALITVGSSFFAMAASAAEFGEPSVSSVLGMISSFLGFFVIALIIVIPVYGFMSAGLMGALSAIHRGEEVTFGTFWSMGARYWGRMTLLSIVLILIMLLTSLIGALLLIIPVIGIVLMYLLQFMVSINLGMYPCYLIVREDMGISDALGHGFRALFGNLGEAVLSALMGMVFTLAMFVMGLIGIIPLLGWAVILAAYIFGAPLMTYYYIERFETNVRPNLSI